MSILATDQEITREEQLKQIASLIKKITPASYNELCEMQKRGVSLLWNNPHFTPQEIINEIGSDIIKIFQYHGLLTELIVTLAALEGIEPDIKLPTNAFTVGTDTVTVLDQPYQI